MFGSTDGGSLVWLFVTGVQKRKEFRFVYIVYVTKSTKILLIFMLKAQHLTSLKTTTPKSKIESEYSSQSSKFIRELLIYL